MMSLIDRGFYFSNNASGTGATRGRARARLRPPSCRCDFLLEGQSFFLKTQKNAQDFFCLFALSLPVRFPTAMHEIDGKDVMGGGDGAGEPGSDPSKVKKRRPKRTSMTKRNSSEGFRDSVMVTGGDHGLAGYMEKKATGSFRTRWQKRYFEASGHYLKYYADDNKKELLAAIDLRMVTVPPDAQVSGDSNTFTLDETETKTLFEFRTKHPEEAERWVMELGELQKMDQQKNAGVLNSDPEKVNPLVLNAMRMDFKAACMAIGAKELIKESQAADLFLGEMPMHSVGVIKGLLRAIKVYASVVGTVKAKRALFNKIKTQVSLVFQLVVSIQAKFNHAPTFFATFKMPLTNISTWIVDITEIATEHLSGEGWTAAACFPEAEVNGNLLALGKSLETALQELDRCLRWRQAYIAPISDGPLLLTKVAEAIHAGVQLNDQVGVADPRDMLIKEVGSENSTRVHSTWSIVSVL
jgi:hypothetical protein